MGGKLNDISNSKTETVQIKVCSADEYKEKKTGWAKNADNKTEGDEVSKVVWG